MQRRKRKPTTTAKGLILLLLCIAGWFFYPRPSIQFAEGRHVLEKGAEYNALAFISQCNGTVTPEKETLHTEEVGEYHFVYTVQKWFVKKEYVLDYTVTDTLPPQITFKETKVFKEKNEEYTLDEMRENVSVDEGTFAIETDYDPEMAGSYHVDVIAEDDYGNISQDSYEVIIKDTDAPFVFVTGNGAQIVKGEAFDVNEIISYGDNADATPSLTIEGEVDTDHTGRYPLHALLEDASGNQTEWDFTVDVVDSIPSGQSRDDFYAFDQFKADYAEEGRKLGIDVSSWQEDIDFQAVKDAGCEFAMIRIGYSYEGELTVDRKFHQNITRAKEAGIPVGIYLFVYDNTAEKLLSSLDMVFAELGDEELDLPFAFDWENFMHYQDYEISFQKLNQMYDVFADEVNKRGYESILYSSKYYLENIWTHTDTRPVWMAHYTSWSGYDQPYQIWQCTDSGRINGIEGNVDLDILFE